MPSFSPFIKRALRSHANGASRLGLPIPCAILVVSKRTCCTQSQEPAGPISALLRYMQPPRSYIGVPIVRDL